MTLSVIMPTYNGSRFLGPQIESILGQTAADFELLVMDDGSTDDTVAIVDDYARRDRRVRRLPSTGNLGQRGRLRQLTEAATGEYLAIADQDDVWHPERNARLLDAIGDRAVALGRSQLIDGEGRDLGQSIAERFGYRADVGPLQALFQYYVSGHAMLIRRSWLNIGAYYGLLEFDRMMGLEAVFSTGLTYVDDAVVFHRIHGANQSNGWVADTGPRLRRISPHRARMSLNFLKEDRWLFHITADELGRSAALAPPASKMFRQVSGACYNAWHRTSDRVGARGDRLERFLIEQFAPYAASDADLAFFRGRIRSLTRGQFGFTNLRKAVTKYVET